MRVSGSPGIAAVGRVDVSVEERQDVDARAAGRLPGVLVGGVGDALVDAARAVPVAVRAEVDEVHAPGGRVRRDRPQRQRLVPLPRVLRVGSAPARRYGRRPFGEEERDRIAGSGRGSGKVLVWSGSMVSGPTLPNGSQEVEGSFRHETLPVTLREPRRSGASESRTSPLSVVRKLRTPKCSVSSPESSGPVGGLAGTLEHDVARVGAERGRHCQGGDGQGEERGRGDGVHGRHPGAGGTCDVGRRIAPRSAAIRRR